jgi:type I restriction-modification system DNA methylase subunit
MSNYYRNEYLFSEIYLEEITQIPEQAEVLASLNTLKEYRDYADISNLQTWKSSYVHTVLQVLGFNIQVESENVTQLFPMGMTENPISICYILMPHENLDNTTMGRNWAEKIIRNLREHEMQWGLLTNGEQWRIYHQDEPTPYETYLEIDLAAILADKAREAYQIFHKFMQAKNFTSGEHEQCQFDHFKQESQNKIAYIEKELENALKQKEEGGQGVLSSLCMGYVESLRQNGDPDLEDEALRRKIYHGAMLYMFRLLFLYYADARELLSDNNHQMLAEVRQAAHEMTHSGNASEKSCQLWQDLETIFVDIDQTYNGGLFNPHESEFTLFIEEIIINDSLLTPAIYHLTYYREENTNEKLISYRDMNVRHLGTLYEGLLEHKIFIAKEDTQVVVSKNAVKFIPASLGGKMLKGNFIPKGMVYFGTEQSEKKLSGSYFTPEDVVDYIVFSTVGEKLDEIREDFRAEHKVYISTINSSMLEGDKNKYSRLLEDKIHSYLINVILRLTILDPAMGSGHFLVNVTNNLSNFITEFINSFNIQTNLDTATSTWRRHVVENCIFGVDLNPLAVELAKLSLWIMAMAKDYPLSFLSHHLKAGNSLRGTRLRDVGKFPGNQDTTSQISFFSNDEELTSIINASVEKSKILSSKPTNGVSDLQEKKTLLDEIELKLQNTKSICDFHSAVYEGLNVTEWDYQAFMRHPESNFAEFSESRTNYFHWELEFPYPLLENGFDVVLGNPPYVERSNLSYLPDKLLTYDCGNTYAYFFELAIQLLSKGGQFGLVVPISIVSTDRMSRLQKLIISNSCKLKIANFAVRPATLFSGVDMNISIVTGTRKSDTNDGIQCYTSGYIRWFQEDRENLFSTIHLVESSRFIIPGRIPKVSSHTEIKILEKLNQQKSNVAEFTTNENGKILYYHSGGRYWRKAILDKLSTEYKPLSVKDKYFFPILALLNSNLFYWYWIVYSDCYHVVKKDVLEFPLDCYSLTNSQIEELTNYSEELMKDYEQNSTRIARSSGGKSSIVQYNPRLSKPIIDKIDKIFSKHYEFNSNEEEFILSFDGRFRGFME